MPPSSKYDVIIIQNRRVVTTSVRYQIFERRVRASDRKSRLAATGQDRIAFLAQIKEHQSVWIPYDYLIEHVDLAERQLGNSRMLILSSRKQPSGAGLLYLYGGHFFDPPGKEDFRLAAKLCVKSGCDVCILLYPLFPQYSLHEMTTSVQEAIRYVISLYARSALIGFGEGATLCLCACCKANAEGNERIMPDRLILNSPFLQIPIQEERMKHLEVLDERDVQIPMAYLSKDGLCAKVIEEEEEDYRYLGDLLNASLIGLPETDVYFGTNENAYACLPEFLEKCRRENIRLHPHVGEGMMHCWGLYDNCEESRTAIKEYIELIRGLNPQKQQER